VAPLVLYFPAGHGWAIMAAWEVELPGHV
jgi:hypothetical protein